MKNIDEKHLKVVGETVNVDFGLVCTQLIAIESNLKALNDFILSKATKKEKIEFYKSITKYEKELEIKIYNVYKETKK